MAKKKKALTVGEKIKAARLAAELGQAEAARLIGVSQPYLSQIEVKGFVPSIGTLQKIAAALGVTLRDLLPE